MSVIRIVHNKENPYVQLNKQALWNQNLSLKAIGLWARCMSRPDDWRFNVKELTKKCKEGRRAIDAAIHELIKEGYAVRLEHFEKEEDGRFSGGWVEYIFFEFPVTQEEKQKYIEEFKKSFRHCGFGDCRNGDCQNSNLLIKEDTTKKENKRKREREGDKPPPPTNIFENEFEGKVKIDPENYKRLFEKFKDEALIREYAYKLFRWSFSNPKKFKEKIRHDMVIEDWIEADLKGKVPTSLPEENKRFAQKVEKKFPNAGIEVMNDCIIFVNHGAGKPFTIPFNEFGFKDQVLNRLRKMSLQIEGLQ